MWGLAPSPDARPRAILLGHALSAFMLLDLGQYLAHWAEHRSRVLWRAQGAHHSDPEMDVSTALRFHPLEVLLRTAVTLAIVSLFALPLSLMLVYAACSHIVDNFAHADLTLPPKLDRLLRGLIVTPDLHRIHHSARADEQGANFGATLSLWDRLFGTFVASASAPARRMRLGLDGGASGPQPCGRAVGWLLLDPVRRPARRRSGNPALAAGGRR